MNDRALLAQARVRALTNPNCVKTSGSLADFLEEIHIEEPSVDYPYRDKINGRWGEILYLGFINSRHVGDLHHGTWVWKTRNPDTLLPVVEEAIRATGATVEVLDAIELDAARVVGAGFYNPETGKIFVFPFRSYRSAAHYYGSILHEITHWTGAKDRLKRGVEAGPSETRLIRLWSGGDDRRHDGAIDLVRLRPRHRCGARRALRVYRRLLAREVPGARSDLDNRLRAGPGGRSLPARTHDPQ
jgi:hypothetical protein